MKRMIAALALALTIVAQASAMGYEQARREALFLTDKMAYELNLTSEQYDAAYEINLDYLMGVTSVDDVYSTYWTRRNLDLSYILLDWQWEAFRAATYFYRPLYWDAGYWHFGVYARYPRRGFYYFDRPTVYVSYRGGHGWHANGGRSFYYDRRDNFRQPQGNNSVGLRDRYDRGDFRGARTTTTGRNSSTRVTVNRGDINASQGSFGGSRSTGNTSRSASTGSHSTGSFGGSRSTGTTTTGVNRSSGTFGSSRSTTTTGANRSSGTFGSSRSTTTTAPSASRPSSSSRSTGTFGSSRSTMKVSSPTTTTSRQTGSFGSSRSAATSTPRSTMSSPSRSSSGSRSTGSFGGSRSGGSSSGGSHGTFGGRR